MTGFDTLAQSYDAGRVGYSNDVYDALMGWGLKPNHRVLDVGCGTGLASAQLIGANFDVTGIDISSPMLAHAKERFPEATWLDGSAEALPFDNASFDAVISAQALHHMDKMAVLREIKRVMRPGALAAFWWKSLAMDTPVRQIADAVARDLDLEAPPRGGISGGFREFYAAQWADTSLRVIPWNTALPLARVMQYERSRKVVGETFGAKSEQYFDELEKRLNEYFRERTSFVPLSFTHYLYLGKK